MVKKDSFKNEQYMKDSKKKLYLTVTRMYVPLICDHFLGSYADTSSYQKVFFLDFYTRCCYCNGRFYYGPEAIDFGDVVFEKNKREKGYLARVFEHIYALGEELMQLSERIRKTDYSKTKKEELISLFRQFSEKYKTYAVSLMGFNIEFPVERELRKKVKDRPNPDEDLGILLFPSKENFAPLEQANLFLIKELLDKKDITKIDALTKEIRQKISDHVYEYGWINARGGQDNPWTEKEIFDRCMEIKGNPLEKLAELQEHKAKIRRECEKIMSELKADENLFNLVMITKELVYFRTYRTDYLNKAFFNVKNLLEAVAKSRNLSHRELIHLRIDEILNGVDVPKDEIARRMRGYTLMTLEPAKLEFSSDPEKIRKAEADYCERSSAEADEVKGTVAFKGKIQGRAKVVITKNEIPKVERGDILITAMTTPEFVPAMEKAVAFVTDEGGITCHAAIVAREMKKPCVIGTKVATKVFKDGDFVEVDAYNGIVRKIR
ncbi:MAG: PEP-utilizing enzyme [archaeon]